MEDGAYLSISYGPSALKDQAEILLKKLDPNDIEESTTRGFVERFLSADEAEMKQVGEVIIDSTDTWIGYEKNFVEALYLFYGRAPY